MQISNYHYNPYGTAYTKSAASQGAARSAQNETAPTSFSNYLDKATISQQARSVAGKSDDLSSVASALKAYNKAHNAGQHKEINTDTWLPENKARLEKINAELEKQEGDPSTRSDAEHKKGWELISQRMVLEIYGETQVVTDEMMSVGAAAYREGEREWGLANGFQIEEWANEGTGATAELIQKLSSIASGDPKELEKQLEEWKQSQLVGSRDEQTKSDFTSYMDKTLGRNQTGTKSPEEKIKELTAKIKTLQARLSEVESNDSLPQEAKSSQSKSLNSQINSLHAQIGELAKLITEDLESAGAEA